MNLKQPRSARFSSRDNLVHYINNVGEWLSSNNRSRSVTEIVWRNNFVLIPKNAADLWCLSAGFGGVGAVLPYNIKGFFFSPRDGMTRNVVHL